MTERRDSPGFPHNLLAPPGVRGILGPVPARDLPTVPFPPPADSPGRAAMVADLGRARSVLLVSHENPDADGAGSALALQRGLRALGLRAEVAFPTPLPRNLLFLPGAADAWCAAGGTPPPEDYLPDTVVSLDCGAAHRLGGLLPLARAAERFLNVDHHAGNDRFGTAAWVDPAYAATGTMALELLQELGVPPDVEGALCIYTALVTDTGNFAYSNTDPRSHGVAAACLALGVKAEEVTRHLHRRRSEGSWRLEGEVALGLRTAHGGALAWVVVPRDLAARWGTSPGETPDLVRIPVSLEETRIGFILEELPGGGTRVSLRSRCPVGVHTIAAAFGGGGHPRAAGFFHAGDGASAEALLLPVLERALGLPGDGGPPPQDA